jgi:crotonobetainyl-CoA:carnitine CoA-transferase CaiB-like acyl-CoA transferase
VEPASRPAAPASGPLAGVRVLELAAIAAGPLGSMLLADMGAEVIKVEKPGGGDDTRTMDVNYRAGESGYFLGLNKNKRSIVLDLKDAREREIVYRLAREADVVVQSGRRGVAEHLGVDPARLCELNPRLVYCSITGFGSRGRMSDRPAYDVIAQAVSGILDITGEEGGPPVKPGPPIADLATGLLTALAVCAALVERSVSGRGQAVEVSLAGGALAMLAPFLASQALGSGFKRVGHAHNTLAPYQAYLGSDGRYFVLAVANDHLFGLLCELLELTPLVADARFETNAGRAANRAELNEYLVPVFATAAAGTWVERLTSVGVPATLIATLEEAIADPDFFANGYLTRVAHPAAGEVPVLLAPMRFERTPVGVRRPPPRLDEHGAEIRDRFWSL